MKIIFLNTYPLYHTYHSLDEWFNQIDRERVLAARLAERGFQAEIWGADKEHDIKSVSVAPDRQYTIRVFPAEKRRGRSKFHYSDALVEYARDMGQGYYLLKGIDGGVGRRLLARFLIKSGNPHAFILGGGWYSRFLNRADLVFYESSLQRMKILKGKCFLAPAEKPDNRLIRLPKWVDHEQFQPGESGNKRWDILVVSRLISYYKDFSALGGLSRHFKVAVAGDGPMASRLQSLYPEVTWLGFIPHSRLPEILKKGRILMHISYKDFYPRAIAEALSCGLPCAAFNNNISEDVVPESCGLLVDRNDFLNPLKKLLEDKQRMQSMSRNARKRALNCMGEAALENALNAIIHRVKGYWENFNEQNPG